MRHGFAIEAYKQGKPLNKDTIKEVNEWVSFVMLGNNEDDLPF